MNIACIKAFFLEEGLNGRNHEQEVILCLVFYCPATGLRG